MKHFEWENSSGCVVAGFSDEPTTEANAVVCIVHGLGEHAGRYHDVTHVLADAGIAVYAIDLCGHGLSDGKRGDIGSRTKVLEDVKSLVQKAKEEHPELPVWLYGHSLGGNIVLSYRLMFGQELAGVIASSPWLILANPVPAIQVAVMKLLVNIVPRLTIKNGLDSSQLSTIKHVGVDYRNDPLVHPYVSLQTGLDAIDYAKIIMERAEENHGPVLLLHGSDDKICLAEGSRQYAERAKEYCTYHEWPGMRHELHHESIWPQEAQEIADFVLSK